MAGQASKNHRLFQKIEGLQAGEKTGNFKIGHFCGQKCKIYGGGTGNFKIFFFQNRRQFNVKTSGI